MGKKVRVRLLALIDLTLELERMTPGIVAGEQGKLFRKSGRPRDFGGQKPSSMNAAIRTP